MALRLSTGFCNTKMDSAFNAGAGKQFDSGVLEIRTGSQPASADDAPTGTLLASISLPADAFGAASSRAVAKAGTWQDASADAAGTAGWCRLRESTDGGGSSSTDRRIDGSVTATGGGGDLTLDNAVIAVGQVVTIDTYTLTQPNA